MNSEITKLQLMKLLLTDIMKSGAIDDSIYHKVLEKIDRKKETLFVSTHTKPISA